jgi:phosphosulfolactate phosphohydrolase-like enzyme
MATKIRLSRWSETPGEPKDKQNLRRSGSRLRGDEAATAAQARGRSPHQNTAGELSDSAEIALRAYVRAKPNLAEAICRSENALRLLAIPELHDDVAFCLRQDVYNLVAGLGRDGAIRILI